MGGVSDSTNIVPKPIVTGITALGLDHTSSLGKTIEAIAEKKGGIYKAGTMTISSCLLHTLMMFLERRTGVECQPARRGTERPESES